MWEETDDLVYLEEKSKKFSKQFERLNRIKKKHAEERINGIVRQSIARNNGNGGPGKRKVLFKSRKRRKTPSSS